MPPNFVTVLYATTDKVVPDGRQGMKEPETNSATHIMHHDVDNDRQHDLPSTQHVAASQSSVQGVVLSAGPFPLAQGVAV